MVVTLRWLQGGHCQGVWLDGALFPEICFEGFKKKHHEPPRATEPTLPPRFPPALAPTASPFRTASGFFFCPIMVKMGLRNQGERRGEGSSAGFGGRKHYLVSWMRFSYKSQSFWLHCSPHTRSASLRVTSQSGCSWSHGVTGRKALMSQARQDTQAQLWLSETGDFTRNNQHSHVKAGMAERAEGGNVASPMPAAPRGSRPGRRWGQGEQG